MTVWPPGPWVIDLVIAGLVIEWAGLWWLHHRHALGPRPADLAPGLGAGLALMLLCRFNLSAALEPATLLLLALAGVLHAVDLARRWPRSLDELSRGVSR